MRSSAAQQNGSLKRDGTTMNTGHKAVGTPAQTISNFRPCDCSSTN